MIIRSICVEQNKCIDKRTLAWKPKPNGKWIGKKAAKRHPGITAFRLFRCPRLYVAIFWSSHDKWAQFDSIDKTKIEASGVCHLFQDKTRVIVYPVGWSIHRRIHNLPSSSTWLKKAEFMINYCGKYVRRIRNALKAWCVVVVCTFSGWLWIETISLSLPRKDNRKVQIDNVWRPQQNRCAEWKKKASPPIRTDRPAMLPIRLASYVPYAPNTE